MTPVAREERGSHDEEENRLSIEREHVPHLGPRSFGRDGKLVAGCNRRIEDEYETATLGRELICLFRVAGSIDRNTGTRASCVALERLERSSAKSHRTV